MLRSTCSLLALLALGCGDSSTATDAGPEPRDAGGSLDAGSSIDAGAAIDAGMAIDAGLADSGADTDGGATGDDAGASDDAGPSVDGGPPGATASFLFRRDFRRCAAPLCGGWFVQELNRPQTICFDGTAGDECYVADIDWSPSGYSTDEQNRAMEGSGGMIVDGRIVPTVISGVDIGLFEADAAWVAEWGTRVDPPTTEPFHGLEMLPISCLVAPCFNIEVTALNVGTTAMVSELDLTATGASDRQQELGQTALGAGTLRATGQTVVVPDAGPGGDGARYAATQFYLPVRER